MIEKAGPTPDPQPADYLKARYTKYEFRVPMRDGKRLFTAAYVPKDASQAWPILMKRTPYGLNGYGVDKFPDNIGPSRAFEESGYIFVFQDVRGRNMSEGEFSEMRPHRVTKRGPEDVDESTDAYDTIEFLLKQLPNHNGSVGLIGISYPGFFAVASMIDSHPALKAASPQAPMTDLFMGDDAYHNGAFHLASNCNFFLSFKPGGASKTPRLETPAFDIGPDGYDFFLKLGPTINLDKDHFKGTNPYFLDRLLHTTYDDYWQARDISIHLKNITCAVLTVGGWFDAEDLAGPFRIYHGIRENNPQAVNKLVIGPWPHNGWQDPAGDRLGDVRFNVKTAEFFRTNILLPFFEHHLKGKAARLPGAYVFETGRNVWRSHEAWPPSATTPKMLYLRADGKLSFEPPSEESGNDEYTSDPARPVPFTSYVTSGVPPRYMVDDQRFAARRPDVLVYQTDILEEDVTIAGPVSPRIFVSTTGTDADFIVKLIDVYPTDYPPNKRFFEGKPLPHDPMVTMGGYQQLLRGEPIRAKFREGWGQPKPMTPLKMEKLSLKMPDVYHTFRRGHSIMIQIQSSWFPLIDRNPQTFTDIPRAKPEDFRKATQRVFRNRMAASGVEVLVLTSSTAA